MTKSQIRVGVIINPPSGRGGGAKVGAEAIELLRALPHVRVLDLSAGDQAGAQELASQAILNGEIQALVVVGGDGTAQLGVNLCADTDVPLGVISAGTGNDTARALGLHEADLASTINKFVSSVHLPRRVDVMRCEAKGEDFWSFGSISAGFDALCNARANRMSWPKGPSRYTLAMLAELASFKPIRYRAVIDGQDRNFEAMLCVASNAQSFGGGMLIVPHADINDGFFDLLILHKISRPELLKVFPKVFKGNHVNHPAVEFLRCRELHIEAISDVHGAMPCFADGEAKGHSPLRIKMHAGALKVLG
jgi:diacylglycerol kinase (ATP)